MRTTEPEEIRINPQHASDYPEAVQLLEDYIDQPESVPDSIRSIYKALFQELTNPTTNDVRIQELVTTLRTYNDAQQKIQTTESIQTTTVTSTTQE